MEDPEDRTVTSDGVPELENANYDFSNMPKYSMLDYSMLKFSGGFEILVQPGGTFTVDGAYAALTDDGIYVYGEETGSLYMIRSGVRIDL